MRCPFCKKDNDKVIDSRASDAGQTIRRRRQCLECRRRFTTYERTEAAIKLVVVKKDGSRVPYDRQKVIDGVAKACYKRPVPAHCVVELAENIEESIMSEHGQEVPSRVIGEKVMQHLQQLDKVAYVRYASVYREFQDVGQFIDEVQEVMLRPADAPGQGRLFDQE